MDRQLVARSGSDGSLRVTAEPLVVWEVVGAEPPVAVGPATDRDEIRLLLAEAGVGPRPIVSFSTGGESKRVHLGWPDARADDQELARVVALASLPFDHEIPELAEAAPDPEFERQVEQQLVADRQLLAGARRICAAFPHWRPRLSGARGRRQEAEITYIHRRSQSQVLTAGGRLRARARVRHR